MRPPPRPGASRAGSSAPSLSGRASPADSSRSLHSSTAASRMRSPIHPNGGGVKRKAQEFDPDLGEETNINVVVRCRGRSEREVKENSGVVVFSTDGIKGKNVDLSMGANALSNKTYTFDRVFSPAADQAMVFDEVVAPIMDEVLAGFNCTIFAYGQTGTGKTYTMSGDISDVLPLPDDAGIIPRVLHSLFTKLENQKSDNSVKCSFIELYNEELRDLLSADETAKLKIFDDSSRKSHGATMVQGMEETHISSAHKGIQLLREGSHKRQVAATKCNDLSSRSHTVFTVTVHIKVVAENGEEHVSVGKLNLVDLAGSENIQRSGAENKRAAEAGLINKSLLTLGRVINALVEKGSHIPYRESKLTRLLQDSLGGRTKTCIIATLSPAKSNLEETISTLDYAFRAKNIRNKPQTNYPMSKKTLLREFTAEIEKLKSELIATRHRNGVYLTAENFEQITTESESRRILSEEQRDKIDTMEVNLRNKAQDLFSLTSNFNNLKKDNETTKVALAATQDVVEQTEIALEHTKRSLAEEQMLREAHEVTEGQLAQTGQDLISQLGKTTSDISGLHSKLRRRSDLQSLNRTNWNASQSQVSDATQVVEQRLSEFETRQLDLITQLSDKMQSFVQSELAKTEESRIMLDGKIAAFAKSEAEVNDQAVKSRDGMEGVLEEIKILRDDVKQKVGEGLGGLTAAAQQISAGILTELEGFHVQLHSSYNSFGKDLKNVFDDLVKALNAQQEDAGRLREELSEAGTALMRSNEAAAIRIDQVMAEEKRRGEEDRADLFSQITSLVQSHGTMQEKRLQDKLDEVKTEIGDNNSAFEKRQSSFNESMDGWVAKDQAIVSGMLNSRESIKTRIKQDWNKANQQNMDIQDNTRAVHEETVRIVDEQMRHIDDQLQALDEIVSRVRTQNDRQHESHVESLHELGSTVRQSYSSIGDHMAESSGRSEMFAQDVSQQTATMTDAVEQLPQDVHQPLADLRTDILGVPMVEYRPTGQTPQKVTYQYATDLPRTAAHNVLLKRFREPNRSLTEREEGEAMDGLSPSYAAQSPSKAVVYTDADSTSSSSPTMTRSSSTQRPQSSSGNSLRELSVNLVNGSATVEVLMHPPQQQADTSNKGQQPPPLKKQNTGDHREFSASIGPGTKMPKKHMKAIAEGRENQPLSASVGHGSTGRVLRSRNS
ncbi:hypothetical protein FH972_021504 [Carpinus fangiana]|uniref:Kinesin motor domain-containing protein n=1 Tax=Carpinus fangiana TaxID=176857 RepID=A0A5N6KPH4_9ROSI|nr:hypothetical protein FH972_021504 [Carpinus fangiana]